MKEDDELHETKDDNDNKQGFHFNAVYANRYKSVQAMDREERNKQIHKDIEMLASHATNSSNQTKQALREHVAKLLQEDLRVAEQSKITEILREIEFSEPETLFGMFDYRQRDLREKIRVQRDVKKEYKEGALDPNKFVRRRKKTK